VSHLRRTHARRGHRGRDPEEAPRSRRSGRIEVRWEGGRPWISEADLRRTARAARSEGGRPALSLSIGIVSDRALARMHGEWLSDPTPTDVLSFDLSDALSEAGEVLASHECARRTARARGVEPGRELALYVVHGVLHLCGHDDHAPRDRARMRAAEARVLARLGWPPDDAPHDETARGRRPGP
jgi:probable rRNA maturation factor